MTEPDQDVEVTLRIPGAWSSPREVLERLPPGCSIEGSNLVLPDGIAVEIYPRPADEQFAGIFASACRQPPEEEELASVNRYTVNVCLCGPGGSLGQARAMMQAGAAIINAGGAGVFIDNCAMAHGGQLWREMADDGGSDALSFAFVSIIQGQQEMRTMGMHVLGYPEIVMHRRDLDDDAEMMVEVVRYVAAGEKPIGDGHLLGDEHGPRFQATALGNDDNTPGSPMHNPFGRLRLTSLKDIAEGN